MRGSTVGGSSDIIPNWKYNSAVVCNGIMDNGNQSFNVFLQYLHGLLTCISHLLRLRLLVPCLLHREQNITS